MNSRQGKMFWPKHQFVRQLQLRALDDVIWNYAKGGVAGLLQSECGYVYIPSHSVYI